MKHKENMTRLILIFLLILGGITSTYIYYTWDNRVTLSLPDYNSEAGTSPIDLGAVAGDRAYISFRAKFMVKSADGYPNLFQSAPLNEGVRIEINERNITMIVNNSPESEGNSSFHALNLTTDLKTNEWYELELEAMDGNFVSATLNGKETRVNIPSVRLNASKIIIGAGFVESRKFKGEIKDMTITKGNYPVKL